MSRQIVTIVIVSFALSIAPGGTAAQQRQLGATPRTTAENIRGHVGRRVTYVCPAITQEQAARIDIWGTDTYTADSSVCVAAIHAGILNFGSPGVVKFMVFSGANSFSGSSRNGVTTKDFGPFSYSFAFDRSDEPGQLDWITTAQGIPADFTQVVQLYCPPGGSIHHPIWGTFIYTTDSSICFGGLHSGYMQSPVSGGRIALHLLPGQRAYTANFGVGIQSLEWGPFDRSFQLSTHDGRSAPYPPSLSPGGPGAPLDSVPTRVLPPAGTTPSTDGTLIGNVDQALPTDGGASRLPPAIAVDSLDNRLPRPIPRDSLDNRLPGRLPVDSLDNRLPRIITADSLDNRVARPDTRLPAPIPGR